MNASLLNSLAIFPHPIAQISESGDFLMANPAFWELHQCEPHLCIFSLLNLHGQAREEWESQLAGHEAFIMNQSYQTSLGDEKWLRWSLKPGPEESCWWAMVSDITPMKSMRERHLLLESAFEAVDDVVVIADAGSIDEAHNGPKVLDVNPAFEEVTGYSRADIIGKTPRILQGPDTDRAELDKIRQALENVEAVEAEVINYKKDGTPFRSNLVINPIRDESGRLTHWVSIQRNISDRLHAQELLKKNSELLNETQKLAKIGGWELEVASGQTFWTEEVYRIHGVDRSFDHNKHNGLEFYHPEDKPFIEDALENAISNEIPFDVECRFINAQEKQIWVRVLGRPVIEQGKVVRVIGLFQDISGQKVIEERLKVESRRLTEVLEATHIGTWEWRFDEDRWEVSTNILLMLGLDPEAGQSLCFADRISLIHPDDRALVQRALNEHFMKLCQHYEMEFRMKHQSGHWIWVKEKGKVLNWQKDGVPISLSGTIEDVSDRIHTDLKIKQMGERFTLAAQSAGIGIWDYYPIENRLEWDEQMYALYGLRAQDFEGAYEAWAKHVHPDDLPRAAKEFEDAIEGTGEFNTEFRVIHPSGLIRYISGTAMIVRNASGQAIRVTGVNYDITEKRQNIEQLHLLQQVVETAKDSIIITEADHESQRILYANRAHEEMTGYYLEDIIGKSPRIFQGPKTDRLELDRVRREILSGKTVEAELVNYRSNGEEFWIHMIVSYVKDAHDRITHFVSIQRDITDRKQAELALVDAKEQAERASAAKSEFLSTMSHEIRTPLNAVIGMTGLLAETQLDHEQHGFLRTIRQGGESLLSVINDILDYSKIEAGKVELEKEPFNLVDPVEDTLELLAGKAFEKGIELMYQIEKDCPKVIVGDVTRLRQILVNLVGNAIKFTEKGEIVVRVHQVSSLRNWKTLQFSVQDTGIGIPPQKLNRLFQSFSQVDASTTRKYGGTGLGLAISKQLVQLQGGRIWVESVLKQGSTFHFTIIAEEAPVSHTAHSLEPILTGKQVLVVDDNLTNLTIIEHQLASIGVKVFTFSDPILALNHLRSHPTLDWDLAILDFHMPGMDGVELGRRIRSVARHQDLPLMLLSSGNAINTDEQKQIFTQILQKPVRKQPFLNHLKKMITRQMEPVPGKRKASQPEIDLSAYSILLTEDNQTNQKVAKKMLEKFKVKVEVANNGLEALEFVKFRSFDLILMDMQMPEMDGVQATLAIRALPDIQQPLILAMTANTSQQDRQICFDAGMDDFISKPIKLSDLRTILHQWLVERSKEMTS
ncbi:PAS domain-containing protein [Pontibacter sp. G13]|uniref:PAS domain-containing protein n=1 Tax=Pontibacter sp. G13 TaxID=3074898 RepID=UPI002889AD32|nr:PAS domain-containing protein [Pontibacter sp. G13]WNJ19862.1 PAS domain-containing protein [Pontibacter sp. G13]